MTVAWNASHILAIGGGAAADAEKDDTVAAYKRTDYFEQRRAMMIEWASIPNQQIQWLRHATSGVLSRTGLRRPPWSASVTTGIETNLSAVIELAWDQPHLSALRQARDKLVAVLMTPSGTSRIYRPSGRYRDKPAGVVLEPALGYSRTFRPSDIHITSLCSSAMGVTAIARRGREPRGGPMSFNASAASPVLIPSRHFAGEIGRSRQFMYSEMKLGRLQDHPAWRAAVRSPRRTASAISPPWWRRRRTTARPQGCSPQPSSTEVMP